jgi:hypothetical protein
MSTPPSCHQLLLGRSDSIIPCPATSNHTTSIATIELSHNRIKQAEQYILYPNHFASQLNTFAQQRLRRQPLSGALRRFETSLKYGVPPATGYRCTLRRPTRALMSLDFRASHPLRWFGPLINISPCSALQTASIHDNQNPWPLDKHLNPCGSSPPAVRPVALRLA